MEKRLGPVALLEFHNMTLLTSSDVYHDLRGRKAGDLSYFLVETESELISSNIYIQAGEGGIIAPFPVVNKHWVQITANGLILALNGTAQNQELKNKFATLIHGFGFISWDHFFMNAERDLFPHPVKKIWKGVMIVI